LHKQLRGCRGYPCPLKLKDFLSLATNLHAAHVLDFGPDELEVRQSLP
jgi:hypothetical protein